MKVSSSLPPQTASWFVPLVVAVVVVLCSVTSRSLWIDEAWTAHFARQPTLAKWMVELVGERETNLQMPVYSIWIWGVEKMVGHSEYALRMANLFWFAPALVLLVLAFPRNRPLAWGTMLVAGASPFLWYYLNEARAYTMQASCSLMVFAALARLTQGGFRSEKDEDRWVWVFAGALALLCGSSLLAMIFAIAPLAMLPVVISGHCRRGFLRRHAVAGLVAGVALAGLAVFYLWTLSLGARATSIAGTDWRNPAFVAYELTGFSGLGPGRAAMRDGGLGSFLPYAGWLAAYGLAAGGLMALGAVELRRRLGTFKCLALVVAVMTPVAFVFAASYFKHFRVLGRHFAAMSPVAILLLSIGIAATWRRTTGKVLVTAFIVLCTGSALSLRFAARHEKEDYRKVAAVVKSALRQGDRVWWNADDKAAEYYDVPLTADPRVGRAVALYLINPVTDDLLQQAQPDWVICGRPDVYDSRGMLARWLDDNRFLRVENVRGFEVWSCLPKRGSKAEGW
jgi:hypothetical protein